ncbi:hypothetical protein ACWOA0_07950 [Ignavigranum ruoffiae]
MNGLFWDFQSKEQQEEYIHLLQVIGSLSNLFSESKTPYLYYRAHENLFCEAFGAKNLSRGDISYDAIKGKVGIGLKTFLNGNGQSFQKVAEFNSESDKIRDLVREDDIVYKIAELRNKRIETTKSITEADYSIYHLITRESGKMNVVECGMDLVDINSIRINKKGSKNSIHFSDKYNEYSFSLSKNTLLKRFDTTERKLLYQFKVDILDNPFEFLKGLDLRALPEGQKEQEELESIILPLYSTRTGEVPERSGLNQWNARGRSRHHDEAYIPIPAWIHDKFKGFFVYSSERKYSGESAKDSPSFEVELPSGKVMKCKVAQAGGKALMSDPNRELGEWILRDILKIKPRTLVTMEMLNEIGIDSVKLTKKNNHYYYLDFVETGSYEKFVEDKA